MLRWWYLGLLLLSSCTAMHSSSVLAPASTELIDHPNLVYDRTIPREQLTLRGVRLGDPRSAIARRRVVKEEDGWVVCDDGARYRIENGQVSTLALWDRKALDTLNLTSPAEIEARFGKPDSRDNLDRIHLYHYNAGKLTVLWNTFEQQVNAINIAKRR